MGGFQRDSLPATHHGLTELENPEYLPMRRAGYDIGLDFFAPLPMRIDRAELVPGGGEIGEIFDLDFRLNG